MSFRQLQLTHPLAVLFARLAIVQQRVEAINLCKKIRQATNFTQGDCAF